MISFSQLIVGTLLSDGVFDCGIWIGEGPESLGLYVPIIRKRDILFRPGPCSMCGDRYAPYTVAFALDFPRTGPVIAWACRRCLPASVR